MALDHFSAVRETADLVALVEELTGSRVKSRTPTDVRFIPCPFWGSKTGFSVNPQTKTYCCHHAGCEEKGDVFTFVKRAKGLARNWDALEFLAERAGYTLPEVRPLGDEHLNAILAHLKEGYGDHPDRKLAFAGMIASGLVKKAEGGRGLYDLFRPRGYIYPALDGVRPRACNRGVTPSRGATQSPEGPGATRGMLAGLWAVPRALGLLLRSPRLMAWAAVPVLLTAVVLAGVLLGTNWIASRWLWELVGGEAWWQHVVYYVVVVIVVAATVVVAYFAFSAAAIVVAAPFNDVLSARAESAGREGEKPGVEGSAAGEGLFGGIVRSVGDACRLAAAMLAIQLLVLPLLLIPVAGAAVNVAVTAYLNGVDYLDIVLSRRGFTHAEKKRIIRANRARVLGFGLGLAVILFFPLTTLLVVPVGVVGGTLVCLDLERDGRLSGEGPAA